MLRNLRFRVVVLVCGSALCGCASIVSDDDYRVTFTSSPTGAGLMIFDEHEVLVDEGTTPYSTVLEAAEGYYDCVDYIARFSLEGYEGAEMVVDGNFDEWVIGNLGFGGLIGALLVDPLSGSACELPRRIHMNLAPESVPPTATEPPHDNGPDQSS